MKVELKIDNTLDSTKVVVYAKELNQNIVDFVNKLEEYDNQTTLIGFLDDMAYILDKTKIESIFTEDSKVYARMDNKKYKIKRKMYELEELLNATSFVRISNTEIANFDKVKCMEISGSNTIILRYISDEITYVSRRYVKKIKNYLNI